MDWPGFALAVLVIELTPGPNMAWLAALTIGRGRGAGLSATVGIALGLAFNAVLAAAGMAALLAAEPGWQAALRWAGAALLAALAFATWREGDHPADPDPHKQDSSSRGPLLSGLVLNLLNPKAILFFIAVVPPFLGGQPMTLRLALLLAACSVAIATAVHLGIVAGAVHAREWLGKPARARAVRRILALVMAAAAAWIVLAT